MIVCKCDGPECPNSEPPGATALASTPEGWINAYATQVSDPASIGAFSVRLSEALSFCSLECLYRRASAELYKIKRGQNG